MPFLFRLVVTISILLTIAACRKQEPLRIGFVGGLTGKAADLGVAGRNGAQLAFEQSNAAGGIKGRPVELVVRDDEQSPETARRVAADLIGQNIELIIGPMTSSVAMAMLPLIDASGTVLLSPTVTTTALEGKDDHFLRVIATTRDYAAKNARYQYDKRGVRSVAAIYDAGNQAYCESWLNDYRTAFSALGGRIVLTESFRSGRDTTFQPLVQKLIAAHADVVLVIANAVDAALICQQLRKLAPAQKIAMSEWASTERFMELAGTAAEGIIVSQFLDRNNRSKSYTEFLAAYRARFNQEPGFAGVAGYDAARVALEAYSRRTSGEHIKSAILAGKSYDGVQQQLRIDRFGDADRKTFVSTIRNNRYETVE